MALRICAHPRNLHRICLFSTRASSTFNFDTFIAKNEPMPSYAPGTKEREALLETLQSYEGKVKDIPIVIGDAEIRTTEDRYQVCPFDHQRKIAKFHYADEELIKKSIENCLESRMKWDRTPIAQRAEIFWRAAEMMSTKYRTHLLATTMLGQAKTIWQAEIDAGAEMIDFLRFNAQYAKDVMKYQPISPCKTETNTMKFRGVEGFWAAISPFNFTAIGGHLCSAPALMGNVCVWKPSDTSMLSNFLVYQIFREAGLPPGIINFVPADGPTFGNTITTSPDLAGINFTGSVKTFKTLWKAVAANLDVYKTYPRLMGECGGKNMHFVHPSADLENVIIGSVMSAFEFSGQKCSALSRMYVPESKWLEIKKGMLSAHEKFKIDSPLKGDTFTSAVIDETSFNRCKKYLEYAKKSPCIKVLAGGNCDNSKGYFVQATILESKDPEDKIMQEEIFGPILTVYVYPDSEYREVAELARETSPYALTCAIYAEDPKVVEELSDVFNETAGNFYINDKSTGSVVGQQPFGGSRLSGTNDKAGGPFYLMKFCSPQSIKKSHVPKKDWRNAAMGN